MPANTDFELSDLTSWGESVSFQMQRLGLPRTRLRLAAPAPAGLGTDAWARLPLVVEVPASGEKWDPTGGVWNRAGHWPLMISIGDARTRSAEGEAQRRIRNRKKDDWKAWGYWSWPWWVEHESEKLYWLPGGVDTGRGYSGYWWRHSHRGLSAAAARQRDQPWIDLYGEEAYQQAIAATEWVLALPFPPPASASSSAPAVSSSEPPASLVARASSGYPEFWPAHMAPHPSDITMQGERLTAQVQAAVPRR